MYRSGLFRMTRLLRAPETSPFEILGLKATATSAEIKQRYRELSKQYHPDMPDGSEEKFREVHAAFLILKSEAGLNAARWADVNKTERSSTGATSQRYGRAKGQPGHGKGGLSEEEINKMKAEAAAREKANGWNAFTSRPMEAIVGIVVMAGAIVVFIKAYNQATEDYHHRKEPIALDGVIGKEDKWTSRGGRVVTVQKDENGNNVDVEESEESYVARLSDEDYAKFCKQKKVTYSGVGMYGTAENYKSQRPIHPGDFKDRVPKAEKDKDEEWQKSILEMRKNVQTKYEDFREYFYVNDADNCLNRRVATHRIPTDILVVGDIPNKCPLVLEYQSGQIYNKSKSLLVEKKEEDVAQPQPNSSATNTSRAPHLQQQMVTPSIARRAQEKKIFDAITGALGSVHFTTADKDSMALHGVIGAMRIQKFNPAQHAYTFIEYRDTDSRTRTPECLVAIRNAAIADNGPTHVASQRFIISGSRECQYELQAERDEQVSKGWTKSSEFLVGGVLPIKDSSSTFESTEKRDEERRRSLFGSGE